MQSFPVWTWGGEHFGYLDGEYLWTYDGKNVGRMRGEFIYAPDGSYLGEIRSSNRLLTGIVRKQTRSLPFTPKPARPSVDRRENVASSVMYVGYEDFPIPSAFCQRCSGGGRRGVLLQLFSLLEVADDQPQERERREGTGQEVALSPHQGAGLAARTAMNVTLRNYLTGKKAVLQLG